MTTFSCQTFAPSPAGFVHPQAVFAGLVRRECRGGDHPQAHRHDAHELVIPGSGGYRCRLNRVLITVPADSVLVVAPGDWHEDLPAAGSCHHALGFHLGGNGQDDEASGLPLFIEGILPEQQVVCVPPADLMPLVAELHRECDRHDEAAAAIRQGLVAAIVGRVVRAVDADRLASGPVRGDGDAFCARLATIFRRHESRGLAVCTMARDLGMSERHLATVCRERLGISPARAFTAHRMARAAELLAGTALPVKAVADRLGFSNPFHFSRVFHRCHGRTPSAYRIRPLTIRHAIGA